MKTKQERPQRRFLGGESAVEGYYYYYYYYYYHCYHLYGEIKILITDYKLQLADVIVSASCVGQMSQVVSVVLVGCETERTSRPLVSSFDQKKDSTIVNNFSKK